MAVCATCVSKIYTGVIDDVITGVREFFLDEGLDEQVLSELRQLWEQKLQHMNVFATSEPGTASSHQSQGQVQQQQQQQQQQQAQQQQQQQQQQVQQQQQQTQQAAGASPAVVANLVPVQITVPAQQAGAVPKAITIHVPSNALANGVAGMQLQAILSSPTAAHTFALDASKAAEIIQRKLNQALEENGITLPPQLQQYSQIASTQVDGPADEPLEAKTVSCSSSLLQAEAAHPHTITVDRRTMDAIIYQRLKATQVDGQFGTGDSSSEISDDDDDDDDDKDEEDDKKSIDGEEDEDEAEGPEEEPLNSADDVSEDDTSDMFDTDNVVVCQYDKITRVRNKWKFILKDGIMNLKGKDYLFQKATGEGEW